MAETRPGILSALEGVAWAGRHGRTDTAAGVVVTEMPRPGLATMIARRGRSADPAAAALDAFSIGLPATPRRVEHGDLAFVWSGPDRWLAHRLEEPPGGMEALLSGPLGACATFADQSHARLLLHISGPRVRDALAKGVAVDLHPRMFRTGDTTMTGVAHIAVQLWQSDPSPAYTFSIARSLAGSFWAWLESSAAEYGLELVPAPRVLDAR